MHYVKLQKRGLEGESGQLKGITDQHVEIINQLGLQTAEESRLEHLELKQGVFFRQLGSYGAHVEEKRIGVKQACTLFHILVDMKGTRRSRIVPANDVHEVLSQYFGRYENK